MDDNIKFETPLFPVENNVIFFQNTFIFIFIGLSIS